MTTERFVGRHAELDELSASIDAAIAGHGSLTLVAGEPGIGKTSLCEAATRHATSSGAAVGWASCFQGPTVPFWPWRQLVRTIVLERNTDVVVPEVFRTLGGDVGWTDDYAEGDSELVRVALFDSLATHLRELSSTQPIVLVLDDLHWADVPSLMLLTFFASDLRDIGIAVIGTYRDVEMAEDPEISGAFERVLEKSRVLQLDGLSEGDVTELFESTTGVAPRNDLARAVYERTGGNPLFVRELGRLLAAQHRLEEPPGPLPVPEGVRGVIRRRLAHLTQPAHELLQLASVAGEEFRIDVLAQVTALPVETIFESLDRAELARLVSPSHRGIGRYVFSHALIREVLYDSVPSAPRAAMHRRVGEATERSVSDLEPHLAELAHHFLHALPGGDVAKAVEFSARAGRRSLADLAYEEAVVHLRQALDALDLAPDTEQRSALLLELGDAALRAGDVPHARAVFAEAADIARRTGRPEDLAVAALGFGAGLSGFEVQLADRDQLDLLEEALASLPDEDSSLRAWILARLSVARALMTSVSERRAAAEEAVSIARRIGDRRALAYALSALCDASAGPSDAEERLEMATEIVRIARGDGDRPMELLGRRLCVVAHLETGDVSGAEAEAAAFALVAEALRQPLYSSYVPLWRGMQALLSGDFVEALRRADEAESIGARAHSTNARMLSAVLRFMTALQRNDPTEARVVAQVLFDLLGGIGDDYNELFLAMCQALVGDVEHARPRVRRFVETFRKIDVDSEWLPTCCQFAEAIVACGDTDGASELYAVLLPHRHRFAVEGIGAALHGSIELHLGLLARTAGRGAEAEEHLEAAVLANERLTAPVLTARAQLELASALAARGQHERAGRIAARAAETFERFEVDGLKLAARAIAAPDIAAEQPTPVATGANVFRVEGDFWTLGYEGRVVRVRDAKGLHDLALLLGRPGAEIAALDLVTERGAVARSSGEDLRRPGDAGELLDAQARASYKDRLRELEEEIDDADELGDAVRAERGRAERDALTHELSSAYGLGGRPRRAGDPSEKARTTVTRRIRDAIARLDDAHPALGRHLRNSVRTGTFCSYEPEQPLDWTL